MELLGLEQYLTSLGSLGSSGMLLRCLSRAPLKVSMEQLVMFLMFKGRWLKSLGPIIPILLDLIVW